MSVCPKYQLSADKSEAKKVRLVDICSLASVEYFSEPNPCLYPIVQDIYDGAKDKIGEELKKVKTYNVKLEYVVKENAQQKANDEFSINVDSIEFDTDKTFISNVRVMRTKNPYKDRDLPEGIVVTMGIEVKVSGTNSKTGEKVEFEGASHFYATCLGIEPAFIVGQSGDVFIQKDGDIEYYFNDLGSCYERWQYETTGSLPNEKFRSYPVSLGYGENFWSEWDSRYYGDEVFVAVELDSTYNPQHILSSFWDISEVDAFKWKQMVEIPQSVKDQNPTPVPTCPPQASEPIETEPDTGDTTTETSRVWGDGDDIPD